MSITKGKLYEPTENVADDLMANKEYFHTKGILDEAKKEFPDGVSLTGWYNEDDILEVRKWFKKYFGEKE